MKIYTLLRTLLFTLPPETAHYIALNSLKLLPKRCFPNISGQSVSYFGLDFPNIIGLAAGLDTNGDYIDALAKLGFGFIEVGTVTPRPQLGNPKPRLFRIPEQQALINRMGFNNKGINYLVAQLQTMQFQGVLGVNIGKNKETPLNQALSDYEYCLTHVYPHASYVTVNISSPNTPGLRELQSKFFLTDLLKNLKHLQSQLEKKHKKYVPLLIKIAPDLADEQIKWMAEQIIKEKMDGIIATNTTLDKSKVNTYAHGNEEGGLSGKPLLKKANDVIKMLRQHLPDDFPIIGVGGITDAISAQEKIKAGATLIQVYTGLIYHGTQLLEDIQKAI